ncbi:MAG: polysaccharide biosynthesis tyrosine autokinase [Prevotella sp.]|nr:polysaccharide biosynthesis tyrosine autokinase [Prevotella sp.]
MEEKKIALEALESMIEKGSSGRPIDLRRLFAVLVLNWYWFILSLLLCIGGGIAYLKLKEPVYKVSARMLIKGEEKNGNNSQILSQMEDFGFLTNSNGIENEMEILKSRILFRDVVKDLKLYTEYRRVEQILKPILYGKQPLNVDLDPAHLDSIDRELLNGVNSIEMTLSRDGQYYVVQGQVLLEDEVVETFVRKFTTLPATFRCALGSLTFTANTGHGLDTTSACAIRILPPMQVATNYLRAMTIEPTSDQTSIALLTLKDKNVKRGMDFLRHLTVCYNRQANADKNEIALKTEEFINARINKINKELGSTEGTIEEFKRRNAVTDVGIDATSSVQMSSQFSAQLSEANAQVQILDNLRQYVNNPGNRYQVIPTNIGITDATSTQLINSYNKAVQDRNRLLKAASEKAPQVQTLTSTIDELQASIQNALMQARRSADINRQGIQSQYNKFQGKVSAAPVAERVLNQIGRQQDVKSGLYMMLLQKREENTISLAATADKGKLIDEPLLEGKVSPKNLLILLAALVLGILIPVFFIWMRSLFRYKVEGHDDVAALTSLPLVADVAVASEQVKGEAGIAVQADSNTQIDEIFRSLRTNIQFMLKGGEKVIMFTSAGSGEGKTFNAANLAMSFALLGKKVVLCGLDIRKPALGHLFNVSDRVSGGMTSLLTMEKVSEQDLRSQLVPSGLNPNLDLLLAGPIPPNPTELLARDSFGEVVTILRQLYDYVIFDTAPVGLVSDTIQIGKQADVTVFVCRADYTPKSALNILNDLSSEGKLPNPCVILNGIDMSKRKYGYYYGYGRYGHLGRYGYGGHSSYGHYGTYGQYAASHYGSKNDNSIKK